VSGAEANQVIIALFLLSACFVFLLPSSSYRDYFYLVHEDKKNVSAQTIFFFVEQCECLDVIS